MSQPDQPRQKIHFALPDGYWTWSQEQKLVWAREVASRLQEQLLQTGDRSSRSSIGPSGSVAEPDAGAAAE